jgi:hypothetical protein
MLRPVSAGARQPLHYVREWLHCVTDDGFLGII